MATKNSKLQALASFFAAYLVDQFGEAVKGVYLFGSVARGEATKESDIDIFVDAIRDKAVISRSVDRFENTTAAKTLRATRVKNPIRALVGDLGSEEFSDIRLSIAADGIILYGKTLPAEKGRRPCLLVLFTAPQKQKHKVAFLRKLYGRVEKGKQYPGLVQELAGFKAGPGTVIIPIRYKAKFLTELEKAKLKYTIRNIWL